ncbi:uncharacterized protein LOC115884018 [Sitophilus oryzae]|uniref:Uncharacterized protein LOC115884018 n=1 Tax=Sitophilus oryzae TaxID=7048 RepID=A0A6J2Y5M4_SITOR|nr:uncharacterized protein LOC115884018 [Sitophilus oryzae]
MTNLGIGEGITEIKHYVDCKIYSAGENFSMMNTFLVINKIADIIPSVSVDIGKINIPIGINLADKAFGDSGKIDILLGSRIFWQLLSEGQISLGKGYPKIQNTKLGWVVVGPVDFSNGRTNTNQYCKLAVNTLDQQLERFWQLEEFPIKRKLNVEEQKCEDTFKQNTVRNRSGRFVVELPTRDSPEVLGNSLGMAINRFGKLEKRFTSQISFKEEYSQFMRNYLDLGHMTKVGDLPIIYESEENTKGMYYLPHHGVLKETSTTTKLRTVFDVSSPADNGVSLNNILMVGAKLQQDLFQILIRFRQHQIVISGDIEKMYRQVLIKENQRDLQRILWRFDTSDPIGVYRLNTITYGTGPAAYLAVRCLTQLAHDYVDVYPIASQVILRDFYMDDLLTGSDTIQDAIRLRKEIDTILRSAGFILRKWMSNYKEVLDGETSDIEQYIVEDGDQHKTLGLGWNSKTDLLYFQLGMEILDYNLQKVTKRKILSLVAQIFDPLGLVGPILVKAKLILQALWRLTLDWDDEVPLDIKITWGSFQNQIAALNKLHIPRKTVCKDSVGTQLHCFSDASESAYGACVYLRSQDEFGKITCRLICSKSRIAPLKVISLPRLELCGALLAARLGAEV